MGATHIAIPKASHAPAEVATTTARKTVLQVAPPTPGMNIRVCGWGISGDGSAPTNAAGIVDLIETDAAAAALTPLAPELFASPDQGPSVCVQGAALTGYGDGDSTEGSITSSRLLDAEEVHPQTGYAVWFPEDCRPVVKAGRFLRIRTLYDVNVNVIPWVAWAEPA